MMVTSQMLCTQLLTVIVDDGDLTDAVVSDDGCFAAGVLRIEAHLDEEDLVGLPLVVVDDLDLERLVRLVFLEHQRLLHRLVVLFRLGAALNRLHPAATAKTATMRDVTTVTFIFMFLHMYFWAELASQWRTCVTLSCQTFTEAVNG